MLFLLLACGPYAGWPDQAYPHVYTPETDLQPYEEVRWETETWDTSDGTMTGLYLQKAFYHRPGAPLESLEHFETMRSTVPSLGDGIELAFAGDVMYIDQSAWETYTAPVAPLFEGADLRLGNLETPTSDAHSTEPRELGLYAFNAPSAMLDGLPFDVLQVNNNHTLDAGDEGLQNTLDAIADRGMTSAGVDSHAVVEVSGRRVAILAYTWGLNDGRTSERFDLHIVPFGHIHTTVSLDDIAADIDAVDADHVVVMLHWGFEYEYYPDPHFMVLARQMVTAGADLVVGHGPHVVQPAEWCHVNQPEYVPGVGSCSVRTPDGIPRDAAILYSLGNFGTEMPTLPLQVGIVARATLGPAGVTGLSWAPQRTTDIDGAPTVFPVSMMPSDGAVADELSRLSTHLGEGWRAL